MRYFKIEGTIEVQNQYYDAEVLTDIILEALNNNDSTLGGGIKEVDEEGNDLKQ